MSIGIRSTLKYGLPIVDQFSTLKYGLPIVDHFSTLTYGLPIVDQTGSIFNVWVGH